MMVLFKATWSAAQQDSAYYALAQIDCIRNDFEKALEHIDRSLVRNWHNHKARQLKASILRKLGKKEAAATLIAESLSIDKFNIGCPTRALFAWWGICATSSRRDDGFDE